MAGGAAKSHKDIGVYYDTSMNLDSSIPPLHLCPTLEVQSQNEVCLADISEATVREMVVNIRKAHEKMAETAEKVSNSKKIDQDTE